MDDRVCGRAFEEAGRGRMTNLPNLKISTFFGFWNFCQCSSALLFPKNVPLKWEADDQLFSSFKSHSWPIRLFVRAASFTSSVYICIHLLKSPQLRRGLAVSFFLQASSFKVSYFVVIPKSVLFWSIDGTECSVTFNITFFQPWMQYVCLDLEYWKLIQSDRWRQVQYISLKKKFSCSFCLCVLIC